MWPFDGRLDLMISDMQSEGYDPADLEAVIATAKVYPTANYSLPILLALKRIEDELITKPKLRAEMEAQIAKVKFNAE